MATRQLKFAAGPLIGITVLTGMAAIVCAAIALHIGETERLRGLLRLLGPDAAYWLMLGFALLCAAVSASLFRRLIGDRTAAAIRDDGLWIAGIFLSRFVPWRDVERTYLRTWQAHDGAAHYFLKLAARRSAGASRLHHFLAETGYGTGARLIEGGPAEAAAWIRLAEAERTQALQPRAAAARNVTEQGNALAPVRSFGRRLGSGTGRGS